MENLNHRIEVYYRMPSPRRISGRAALLGLLFVSLAILAISLLSGSDEIQEAVATDTTHESSGVVTVQGGDLQADDGALSSRTDLAFASLLVRALDPDGKAIDDFTVMGQRQVVGVEAGDGYSPLQFDEQGILQGLEAGEWRFRVQAELRFAVTLSITLKPGQLEEREAILRPGALVEGILKNEYGTIVGATWIWFMPPGRTHPYLERKTGGLLRARIEPDGTFTSPLLEPGNYIISVGPLGRSDLADDTPKALLPLSHYSVAAVMGGREQLEVSVPGMPEGTRRRGEVLLLELTESRAERVSRRQEGLGKTEAESELAVQQDADERAADPRRRDKKPRWKASTDRRLDTKGTALFKRVRPGRYRLGLKFNGQVLESGVDFVMESGVSKSLVVSFDSASKGTRREPGLLTFSGSDVLPNIGVGALGFHWSRMN